jgi:NADP-reducing hydrogenase subunit HndC
MKPYRWHVFVCTDPKDGGCAQKGAEGVRDRLRDEMRARGIYDQVRLTRCGSIGLCEKGPNIIVYPEGVWYSHVNPEDVPEIVEEHFLKGRIVQRLLEHQYGVEPV